MTQRTLVVEGDALAVPALAPGLYVVATPIGNLGDITLRALKTLAAAHAIAAEDTRHTGRLLQHFAITAPLLRYDEHGAAGQRPKLMARLEAGEALALVSDAGTPLISDPGYRLVREARAAGVPVFAVPGASAVMAALSIAGLATDTFTFAGFLPAKAGARGERIASLAAAPGTLVLFEAPHRLGETLRALSDGLGPREAVVARELTKRFESVVSGTLADLADAVEAEPVKGEIVILVAPGEAAALSDDDVEALLVEALARLPASAAAGEVARATGRERRALFRRAVAIKDGG